MPMKDPPVKTLLTRTPATSLIILSTTLVWIIAAVQASSIINTASTPLGNATVLWGPAVIHDASGLVRGLSVLFMHVDLQHLLVNMLLLWFVGGAIEGYVGSSRLLALYAAGGFASSAAVLYFQPVTPTAGASGALFALMMILIVIHKRQGLSLATSVALLVVNVVNTFLVPHVSVAGHVGGMVGGTIVALMYRQVWGTGRSGQAIPWVSLVGFAAMYGCVVLSLRM